MARPLRVEYPGAIYHITSRGNDRKSIFKGKADRTAFLDILGTVNKRYNWLCHEYCLMDNHYHIVIETPDGNLSKGMRQLNGVYTQTFNRRHNRVGHIFQGRYKAVLVDRESHLLEVCRYVSLNPIRAGAIKHPEEWEWSSYRGMLGLDKVHPCHTTDWILGQFGANRGVSRRRYSNFVKDGIGMETIWAGVKGQILLGGNDFVRRFKEYIKPHEAIKEIPKCQRYVNRPSLKELLGESLFREKYMRNNLIREAVEMHGYSQKEVASHLDLHYSTVSRLMK
ncbi:MAG: transposase [Patescibacteria group bacterium]